MTIICFWYVLLNSCVLACLTLQRLEHKQTVFDDFQWATKYLVANKYVAPSKVAILGTSNGGILVGACVNQAPELYGAAIAEVGVMDMLRYNRYTIGSDHHLFDKFDTTTFLPLIFALIHLSTIITHRSSWTSEFGNPEDPAAFDWIYKYSPLENVKTNATYPAVLVVTAGECTASLIGNITIPAFLSWSFYIRPAQLNCFPINQTTTNG